MVNAKYWQRGEALDYTNSTDDDIPANSVIQLESRIGVSGCDIPAGAVGSVHMIGVFEIAKTGSSAIKMGQAVYFDGDGITDTAPSGTDKITTSIGYAAADATADAETVMVQIGA